MCSCGCGEAHEGHHGCCDISPMTVEEEVKSLEEMKEALEKRLENVNKRLEVLRR